MAVEVPEVYNIDISSLRRTVESQGIHGMGFLFAKVDDRATVSESGQSSLLELCLQSCLECSNSNEVKDQIHITTTIKRILTILESNSCPLNADFVSPLLRFLYKFWDHPVDVVCHECVDIFALLLSNHTLTCSNCKNRSVCQLFGSVVNDIFTSPSTCRSLFKCMLILLRSYNNLPILNESFVESIYNTMENASLSVVISEIITHDLVSSSVNWPSHVLRISHGLQSSSNNMRSAIRNRLLPILLKNPLLTTKFLDSVMAHLQSLPMTERVLDANLSVAKFLIFSQKKCDSYKLWSDYISSKTMALCVLHCSSEVRIAAWVLLSEHPKKTQPFSSEDISLMKSFYLTNMAEQSPATRQKILSGLKKVLIRLGETGELMIKGKLPDEGLLGEYIEFVQFLCSLSFDSLSVEANFSRRILALSTIDYIFRQDFLKSSGKTRFHDILRLSSLLTPARFRLLVSCLDDSFQLCQILALDLLSHLPFDKHFDCVSFKEDTIRLMHSIRSHNTLASGYRFQLYVNRFPEQICDLLTQFVHICITNTGKAKANLMNVTIDSVHPVLNTVSLLLERSNYRDLGLDNVAWWKEFVSNRLLPMCYAISDVVTPVVNSMSPEGYIPEEQLCAMASHQAGDATTRLHAETSQLLLACCWRAHKHVSNILAWIVTKLFPANLLSVGEVARIGDYYWMQLTECKHCGAFESAVDGFTSLCKFLWKCSDDTLPSPMAWLNKILAAIDGEKDLDNLCSTRRSAGLPHLVTAILATEPDDLQSEALKTAMLSLLEMEKKNIVYRVHSLNILKALFASSALGEKVTIALEWACRVAVSGCSSASWSERNSSAQLAAALRARIFGVTRSSQRDLKVDAKNRLSAFEFFSRFPSLYSYLYEQLVACKDEFSVYPILIFLTHLFPTSTKQYPLAPFIPGCLNVLTWCKAEKLRRLSAAAAIAICQQDDLSAILSWLKGLDYSSLQQNHIHACLLLLTNILDVDTADTKSSALTLLRGIVSGGSWREWCDYNMNILLELANSQDVVISSSSDSTEVSLDNLNLTKRQLALASLKSCRFHDRYLSDWQFRHELYRWMQQGYVPIGCQQDKLVAILSLAVEDLSNCARETDAEAILDVLYDKMSNLTDALRTRITEIIHSRLSEDEWRMPSTVASARRLSIHLSNMHIQADDLEWIESVTEVEETRAKQLALLTGIAAYRQSKCRKLLRALSLLLQDEDCELREQASSLLTPFILEGVECLNPEICFRLISDSLPEELKPRNIEDVEVLDREGLFDACAVNGFAELRTFGDFQLVRSLLDTIK